MKIPFPADATFGFHLHVFEGSLFILVVPLCGPETTCSSSLMRGNESVKVIISNYLLDPLSFWNEKAELSVQEKLQPPP